MVSRPGREDNIKTGVQEVGGDLDWFHLGQDRDKWLNVVNAIMKDQQKMIGEETGGRLLLQTGAR